MEEAAPMSNASLTCFCNSSSVSRPNVSARYPNTSASEEEFSPTPTPLPIIRKTTYSEIIINSTELPPIAAISRRRKEYSLQNWALDWNRLHKYSRNSGIGIIQETKPMEKIPCPYCHSLKVQPLPVSTSWIWKDDPVEVKEKTKQNNNRSYSEFMHSAYLPKSSHLKVQPITTIQQRNIRTKKCRAWLNAHLGLL